MRLPGSEIDVLYDVTGVGGSDQGDLDPGTEIITVGTPRGFIELSVQEYTQLREAFGKKYAGLYALREEWKANVAEDVEQREEEEAWK